MDLAQSLIRSVVRAFYETRYVLVIDALMTHSAMPNEDLALLLGMQPKDLRKLCGKLREDRLITVHSRQETREGQLRPIHKEYYYVNYHATIDAIKYRIHRLSNQVSDLYKPSEQKKDFYCPRCQARYDQLEVLHNVDRTTGSFLCNRCSYVLQRDEESTTNGPGHERSSQLNAQLGKFLGIMGQIDEKDIPANNFDSALAVAIPVHRNEDVNPRQKYNLVASQAEAPSSILKGVTSLASAPLEISLTSSVESSAAEKTAETRRKAELAAQNALPIWHTASTITGETTALGNQERERLQKNDNQDLIPIAKNHDERNDGAALNDELAAYYVQMQQEKERNAREEQDESDDDDDDEFEDVEGTSGDTLVSAASHPLTDSGTPMAGLSPSSHIRLRADAKGESDSESSGLGSVASPASLNVQGNASVDNEGVTDGRGAKRIRVRIDQDEADEEVEFEDVQS